VTDSEYWKEVQFLSVEIEDAIAVFHTYEEMNRFAVEDSNVYDALNRDPLFWNVQSFALQITLFIVLARLFDSSSETHSIHKLLNDTLGNVAFFSKEALALRKLAIRPNEARPIWLDDFLSTAWEPKGAADLRPLKKALAPHAKMFNQIYQPIRHTIAHRLAADKHTHAPLWEKTNRIELGKMLDFLHDLITAIEQLYLNGTKPELGTRFFEKHNQKIRDEVRNVLGRIATSYQ